MMMLGVYQYSAVNRRRDAFATTSTSDAPSALSLALIDL
jgi:hypothetical protein